MITVTDIWRAAHPPTCIWQRALEDGREIRVIARPYNSILTIGPAGASWYDSHYCYETPGQAKQAAEEWDPATEAEPSGWFRHAASGRRRPGGDPAKEYFNP